MVDKARESHETWVRRKLPWTLPSLNVLSRQNVDTTRRRLPRAVALRYEPFVICVAPPLLCDCGDTIQIRGLRRSQRTTGPWQAPRARSQPWPLGRPGSRRPGGPGWSSWRGEQAASRPGPHARDAGLQRVGVPVPHHPQDALLPYLGKTADAESRWLRRNLDLSNLELSNSFHTSSQTRSVARSLPLT